MRNKSKTSDASPVILKKNVMTKVLYWVFMVCSFGTMVASVIRLFVTDHGAETTFNQVFMCLMALISLNIPLIIERKFKVYIPSYITIVAYFLIFFHFVLGEVFRAYDHVKIFDKVLHTTSGVIISLLSFSIISMLNNMQRTKIKLSPFFVVLFTFCFTMTSEYLWEIFEYLVDTFFGSNMQRWQDSLVIEAGAAMPPARADGTFIISGPRGNGLIDTMGDMIVNIFGCLAVCIYAYAGMKLKPDWFTARVMLTKRDLAALTETGEVIIDDSVADVLGTVAAPSDEGDSANCSVKAEKEEDAVGSGKAETEEDPAASGKADGKTGGAQEQNRGGLAARKKAEKARQNR